MTNQKITHEAVVELAKDMLIKNGKVHNHLVAMKENKLMYFQIAYKDDEEKDRLLLALRDKIKELNIDSYWQITEAWLSKDVEVRPKDDPERVEVLMICQYNKDITGKQTIIRFHKEKDKIVFESEELKSFKFTDWTSRFNFFVEDAMGERISMVRAEKMLSEVPEEQLERFKNMVKEKTGMEISSDEAKKQIKNFFYKKLNRS